MATPWRLVDDLDARLDADAQMCADLALADGVARGGLAALRLYRWSRPALSLGRFQPDDDVDVDACARHDVPVVRRPTGGRALLHGGDLTYAVAFARPVGAAGSVDRLYRHVAAGLVAGLARVGVTAGVSSNEGPPQAACFATQQGSDLRVGERKVCGSAQVQRGGVVLQHGSILLERLPLDEVDLLAAAPGEDAEARRTRLRARTVTLAELGAPTDVRVVADALVEGFAAALDLDLQPVEGSPAP